MKSILRYRILIGSKVVEEQNAIFFNVQKNFFLYLYEGVYRHWPMQMKALDEENSKNEVKIVRRSVDLRVEKIFKKILIKKS